MRRDERRDDEEETRCDETSGATKMMTRRLARCCSSLASLLPPKRAPPPRHNTFAEMSFIHAVKQGSLDEVRQQLEQEGADVNQTAQYNTSALHIAASRGNRDVLALLLARGANVNALNNFQSSPLHEALRCANTPDRLACIQLLVDHGADTSSLFVRCAASLCLAAIARASALRLCTCERELGARRHDHLLTRIDVNSRRARARHCEQRDGRLAIDRASPELEQILTQGTAAPQAPRRSHGCARACSSCLRA